MNVITRASDAANAEYGYNISCTLTRHDHKGGVFMSNGYVVRRLTPLECERLQGFPDGWTDIKKKCIGCKTGGYSVKEVAETPDAPRYKAMGNSMAAPVMRWIGERIQEVDNEH